MVDGRLQGESVRIRFFRQTPAIKNKAYVSSKNKKSGVHFAAASKEW